jgi:hypothetical protein
MEPLDEILEWQHMTERLAADSDALRTAAAGLLARLDRLERRLLADLQTPAVDQAA